MVLKMPKDIPKVLPNISQDLTGLSKIAKENLIYEGISVLQQTD